jgi:hypothetical protein
MNMGGVVASMRSSDPSGSLSASKSMIPEGGFAPRACAPCNFQLRFVVERRLIAPRVIGPITTHQRRGAAD